MTGSSASHSRDAAPKLQPMEEAESPGLGLDIPEQPKQAPNSVPYRVRARKYRPQTFAELIGQDAMVKTLAKRRIDLAVQNVGHILG